jgi:hypothetical protein
LIRAFAARLSLIILPVGLLVAAFNYFVDPANIFSSKQYILGIAEILSKGHNVDRLSNYDDRMLHEAMIKRLDRTPDEIVIGSSRIMEIGSDFFPGRSVLNCGVSHANIDDCIAIVGMLDSFQRLPQHILINLDPGLLVAHGTDQWQSLLPYHSYFLEKAGIPEKKLYTQKIGKWSSLFSLDYFKESLSFMVSRQRKDYADIGLNEPKGYGRFPDNTIHYPENYVHPDTMKLSANATVIAQHEEFAAAPEKQHLLDVLIEFLKSRQVNIEFIMLPYYYEYFMAVNQKHQDQFDQSEKYFRKLAADNHISIKGGFNPRLLRIDVSQFYDLYHCSKSAIRQVYLN